MAGNVNASANVDPKSADVKPDVKPENPEQTWVSYEDADGKRHRVTSEQYQNERQ